jgi:AcrR family transcriptional regulator
VSDPVPQRPTRPHGLRTRQRILDAAIDCLVELGYAGTTTLAVQAKAGVSRGSLLHQFPSRDELLVAAVTHLGQARFDALLAEVRERARKADRVDAAIEAMWASLQGPLFTAATELWAAARTHPELRAVLEPAERELGWRFRAGWDEMFGAACRHPRFPELFDLLVSSMRGAALTRHFDHSPRRDAAQLRMWKRTAHEVLDSPART